MRIEYPSNNRRKKWTQNEIRTRSIFVFEKVRPIADQAAELFYNRLFRDRPHYRHMFQDNMRIRGSLLMSTLGLAVGSLNNLEKIIPTVRCARSAPRRLWCDREDYQPVAEAFLWTLEQAFGKDFTHRN